jgi:hypothetical protein
MEVFIERWLKAPEQMEDGRALDGGGHDLVEGGLHAIELKFAHEVEKLGSARRRLPYPCWL